MKKEVLERKVLKIIPDFFGYYLEDDIEEYESREEFIISTLEWEMDLYKDWEEEGFNNQEEVSYIKKINVKRVKNLLKTYYKQYNREVK